MMSEKLAVHCLLLAALLAMPGPARGHGGQPQVVSIRFAEQTGGELWIVVENLGLLALGTRGTGWLCDDAVQLNGGLSGLAAVDAAATTWVAATRFGLFRSEDRGCSFAPVPGPLTEHLTIGLDQHPTRLGELLTSTQTLGKPNDVYRTTDGGRTWTAAGLASAGRIRSLVRSPADPDVVYVSHGGGASRSDDGGARFVPISLGPPDLMVAPEELFLLAGHPQNAAEVYAVVERFPEYWLVRSRDAGESWESMVLLDDAADSMVVTADGRRMLVTTFFAGAFRSDDGGDTWTPAPVPDEAVLSCLTAEPGTGRIYACTRPSILPVPWVVARSDDFGHTWEPTLTHYADIDHLWECPADAPTTITCGALCAPGDPACSPAPEAGPPGDGGVPEAGQVGDAAPVPDARDRQEEGGSGGGGCTMARSAPPFVLVLPFVTLLICRRRP